LKYVFCSDKVDERIEVPLHVRVNYLHKVSQPVSTANFLDESLYESQHSSYSSWTYWSHKVQMEKILKQIPVEEILVVPGDGIGIAASLWRGKVVAGDKYFTNSLVKKETFLETMVRGKMTKETSCLVLSYVTSLMSEIELFSASNWSGPVIWIDSSDRCPLKNMTHVSRNVFSRGINLVGSISLEHTKKIEFNSYTENLLGISSIAYVDVKNTAVQYWEQMRPMSVAKEWTRDVESLVVTSTLAEWYRAKDQGVSGPYFAPHGQIVKDAKPYRLTQDNTISYRDIYVIPRSHYCVPFLRGKMHYFEVDDKFFFCSFEQKERKTEFTIKKEVITLNIVMFEKQKTIVHVVGVHDKTIILSTLYGLLEFDISTALDYNDICTYLELYCSDRWIEKLPVMPKYTNEELKFMKKKKRQVGIVKIQVHFIVLLIGEFDWINGLHKW